MKTTAVELTLDELEHARSAVLTDLRDTERRIERTAVRRAQGERVQGLTDRRARQRKAHLETLLAKLTTAQNAAKSEFLAEFANKLGITDR